jgi:hypothetical protein
MGLVAGLVSFSLGAFLAWTRLGLESVGGTTLGFALPITIGGIAQVCAQYNGYKAIQLYKSLKGEIAKSTIESEDSRTSKEGNAILVEKIELLKKKQQKALGNHIGNMISLFVSACGIPAGIRIAELFGGPNDIVTIASIVTMIGAFTFLASRYMKIMIPVFSKENVNSRASRYGTMS